MSAIKIALVQKKAIPNDKDRNLSLAVQYIREASYLGADIVLFPEMWSNGYPHPLTELLTIRLTLLLKKSAMNGWKVRS